MATYISDAHYKPIAGSLTALTGLSSAKAFSTLTTPAGAEYVQIQARTQDIYCTDDGTTPTSSNGFLLRTTDAPLMLPLPVASSMKCIEAAASASLIVSFYRLS